MAEFLLSAFADEIDSDLKIQMDVLESLGIRHIEMRGVNGRNISEHTPEEAKAIKSQLDARGFQVSAIGSPIGKVDITADFEPHYKLFLHVLNLAGLLGTSYVRLFSFYCPKGEDPARYRDTVMQRMCRMTKAAEEAGIILLHENEKDIYGDTANRCLDILRTINSPYLKAIFDPANFVQVGEETWPHAFGLLENDVVYMHIKDALYRDGRVVPSGEGDGKLPEILGALHRKGFSGFLSLEPHLTDFDGFARLEKNKDFALPHAGNGAKTMAVAYQALKAVLDGLR